MNRGADSCARVDALLLDYAYGELDASQRAVVEAHLASCEACRSALEAISGTRRLMQALEPEPAPEAGLESLLDYAQKAAARQNESRPSRAWRWLVPAFSAGGLALALVFVLVRQDASRLPVLPAAEQSVASASRAGNVPAPPSADPLPLADAPVDEVDEARSGEREDTPLRLEERQREPGADLPAASTVVAQTAKADRQEEGPGIQAGFKQAPREEPKKRARSATGKSASRTEPGLAYGSGGIGTGRAAGDSDRTGLFSAASLDDAKGGAEPPPPAPAGEAYTKKPSAKSAPAEAERRVADSIGGTPPSAPGSASLAPAFKQAEESAPAEVPSESGFAREELSRRDQDALVDGFEAVAEPKAAEPEAPPAKAKKEQAQVTPDSEKKADEDAFSAALGQARRAADTGDHATAVRVLEQLLSAAPVDHERAPEALLMLAQAYERAGRVAAAEAAYDRFLSLYPGHHSSALASRARERLRTVAGDASGDDGGLHGAGWPSAAPAAVRRSKAAPAAAFDEAETPAPSH